MLSKNYICRKSSKSGLIIIIICKFSTMYQVIVKPNPIVIIRANPCLKLNIWFMNVIRHFENIFKKYSE